jgi:hypothetical protein
VRRRFLLPLLAALSFAGTWAAASDRGPAAPDAGAPVVVGDVRVAAAELETAARRASRGRPGRRAAARRTAAARAIERLWLVGEASDRGLRPAADLAALRTQVADALAGPRPLAAPDRFATAFERFHARWRARTRCLPAYRDPYEDRCGDAARAAAGSCVWMGEATRCALQPGARRRWLVVTPGASGRAIREAASGLPRRLAARMRGVRAGVLRLGSRAGASAVARAVYAAARTGRERAASEERAAARRTAERARLARERQARQRDPRLEGPVLAAARDACGRQARASEPYLFGFGMQDVVGQAEGVIAARTAFAEGLRAAARDDIDRAKARPLLRAIDDGNHALADVARADAAGDHAAVTALVARFDERTEPERAISRRLGLGDCLARPAA